jgi:two-component system sensor histidine kinase PilS (NtrC family)
MPTSTPATASPDLHAAMRRELHFFALYRVFEASLLCLVVFSPAAALFAEPRHPRLAILLAASYLLLACLLFLLRRRGAIATQVKAGVTADIVVTALAMHALPELAAGIAMMLLFNIGAAALLLPLRSGLIAATGAGLALAVEFVVSALADTPQRPLAEVPMFAMGYLAIATLTSLLGRQLRASEALAEQRGSQAESLAEVNELIIRRMRTGVLLVDADGEIRLANEAAMAQLGQIGQVGEGRRLLATAAPTLAARLQRWRRDGQLDATPLQLAPGLPEVLPRFARLLADSEQVLIFLDDVELASRRAESLTLATLGRFSASLAHEIRNPLAAISYATQLLEESREIPDTDRRLLEIIHQQTQRMNAIVENVLALARRERAQPEPVELTGFARQFVADYRQSHPLHDDQLEAMCPPQPVHCQVDRRQLQQVITVLVDNALTYGRFPGAPARVALRVHQDARGQPLLDVLDHGPGIPEAVASQLFRPFFTTSPHGTGLGLYIARELCLANQADLTYVPLPAGGACFRVHLARARTIQTT